MLTKLRGIFLDLWIADLATIYRTSLVYLTAPKYIRIRIKYVPNYEGFKRIFSEENSKSPIKWQGKYIGMTDVTKNYGCISKVMTINNATKSRMDPCQVSNDLKVVSIKVSWSVVDQKVQENSSYFDVWTDF